MKIAIVALVVKLALLGLRVVIDEVIRVRIRNRLDRLTIDDLGWTRDEAAAVRLMFDAVADDWDDPSMDAYDRL